MYQLQSYKLYIIPKTKAAIHIDALRWLLAGGVFLSAVRGFSWISVLYSCSSAILYSFAQQTTKQPIQIGRCSENGGHRRQPSEGHQLHPDPSSTAFVV